jgi:all-trans-retinol 13,14-reductase
MSPSEWKRREFLQTILGAFAACGLDWDSSPIARAGQTEPEKYDAVIVGAGLGGLSCAFAFARQGFKTLVLEQHDKAGGYATSFVRPGGFEFDVSLHSTTVGQRGSVFNLIPGLEEIAEVEFVPHPYLYRAIFPEHDIRVPQRNPAAYIDLLKKQFPAEKDGIQALFDDMDGLMRDFDRISAANGKVDMSHFAADYPFLTRYSVSTWGRIVDAKIHDPKLKGIVSALWCYYGLPPSKLASIYYAMPTMSYLRQGGYYPRGRSQTISNALVEFIETHEGSVALSTRVAEILVKDDVAYGVKTVGGHEYFGKVVISNANAYDTFHKLVKNDEHLKDYLARLDQFSVSLSSLQIFLGLKQDLVRELGLHDTEVFYYPSYDMEAGYQASLAADMSNPGFAVMLYDNLFPGYSPSGKNTINLLALQGYDHWKRYEADYWKGNKKAYRQEKERMADLLIQQAEKVLLPGLSKAIEIKEIGTPLTNVRYTGNYRGAIYGWDQTLDNSNPRRLPHVTPIKNLYLAGAWTRPGHGYGGVISSGVQCFGEIMKDWQPAASASASGG